MKRNAMLFLLAAAAMAAGGCAAEAPSPTVPGVEPTVQETAAVQVDDEVSEEMASSEALDAFAADFQAKLKAEGMNVGALVAKDGPALGAAAGYGLDVNGSAVEFYLFDPSSTEERSVKNLKTAQEGTLTIFGVEINGETPVVKCALNGNVALFFPLEGMMNMPHPDKEKILAVFSMIKP